MIWQVDLSLDCMFPGKGELRRNYGISDALVKADHTENVFITIFKEVSRSGSVFGVMKVCYTKVAFPLKNAPRNDSDIKQNYLHCIKEPFESYWF